MTRNEAIKNLLKINLDKIINKEFQANLSIVFKDDGFVIMDFFNNILLIDKILDYDVDFESQKKFILNVADKLFGFAEFGEEDESELTDEMVKHIKMKTAIEKKVLGVDINIDEYIVTINYIDEKGSFKNHSLLLYCKNIEKE